MQEETWRTGTGGAAGMPASTPGMHTDASGRSSATERGSPPQAFPTAPDSASRLSLEELTYTSAPSRGSSTPVPATYSRGRRIAQSMLWRVDSAMLAADRHWHRFSKAIRSTLGGSMFRVRSNTLPTPPFVYQAPRRHELRIKQACALGALVFLALIVRELRTSAAPSKGTPVYTLPELRVLREQRLLAAARANAVAAGGADG
jgi:hypothetical protein